MTRATRRLRESQRKGDEMTTATKITTATVDAALAAVQIDRSGGQGHDWRAEDLSADIREEIACEMLDGGRTHCDDYTASNGQHYRW